MPTQQRYRVWCKTCNEFTLHYEPNFLTGPYILCCTDCKTDYTEIKISEIPKEKVIEQRKRYKERERRGLQSLYMSFLGGYGLNTILNEKPNISIIESDCGQKAIDEEERKRKQLEWEEKQRIKQETAEKFKSIGRNDACACGSGVKYKKCCLNNVEKILK